MLALSSPLPIKFAHTTILDHIRTRTPRKTPHIAGCQNVRITHGLQLDFRQVSKNISDELGKENS